MSLIDWLRSRLRPSSVAPPTPPGQTPSRLTGRPRSTDSHGSPPPSPPRVLEPQAVSARPTHVPERPIRRSPQRSEPPRYRHVHLGVDFGTCWSKLVLRDYEAAQNRCIVIRPGKNFEASDNYRIPSSVTSLGGSLYFGWTASRIAQHPDARTIHSPKMRAAFPEHNDATLEGLSAEDISALVVAYLLQVGSATARAYCASLRPPAVPRMSMSMGVPMSILDTGRLSDRFLRVARVGFDIWKTEAEQPTFAAGLDVDRARKLLAEARERVDSRAAASPREWIRSEAEAGLLWIFKSPLVKAGLYGCVDVGAGTTDVSFFRIRERMEGGAWVKDTLGFYSAHSPPPAMDALGHCIASIEGHGLSLSTVRGQENAVITRLNLHADPRVRGVCQQIFETYRQTWAAAYEKEWAVGAWTDYGLFVLGGGSKVGPVVESLQQSVWAGQLSERRIRDAGFPADLCEWPSLAPFREDAAFLLVAYGLSYLGTDVPEVNTPSQIPPMRIPMRVRPPVDQDEYYPK